MFRAVETMAKRFLLAISLKPNTSCSERDRLGRYYTDDVSHSVAINTPPPGIPMSRCLSLQYNVCCAKVQVFYYSKLYTPEEWNALSTETGRCSIHRKPPATNNEEWVHSSLTMKYATIGIFMNYSDCKYPHPGSVYTGSIVCWSDW